MANSTLLNSIIACSFAVISASSFAIEFTSYEGKDAIKEGQGGAKKTVAGVDFWSDGLPPFKFKLLGFVADRRLKSGLFGMISMSSLESDVAEEAKKVGGDGVIMVGSEAETTGSVGMGQATFGGGQASGFGARASVQKQNSKFAVVKYMKDAAPEPVAAPAAIAAPASPVVAASGPIPAGAEQKQ